jgi:hypothetical protein
MARVVKYHEEVVFGFGPFSSRLSSYPILLIPRILSFQLAKWAISALLRILPIMYREVSESISENPSEFERSTKEVSA